MAVLSDFQAALEMHHTAYGEFLMVSSRIKPEDRQRSGVCGVWSPQQVIAHLAGWQYEAAHRYHEKLIDPGNRKSYVDDEFNAISVADRQNLDWDQTIADLKASYLKLEEAITEVVIANPPKWHHFTSWLNGIGGDFTLHSEQLKEWIE